MTAVLKQNKMASSSSKSNSKDNKDFRDRKSKSSDVDSSKEFSGAPNMFANDGSFFEMFQRKMKEMEQASGSVTEQCEQSGPVKSESALKHGEMDEKRTDQTEKETSEDSKLGSSSLSLQGKRKLLTGRMGGAAKQLTAKKKKEEKEKEKEKNTEQEGEEKSSAWKAYLEEVRKYREMSCTDDVDRVRPLVK